MFQPSLKLHNWINKNKINYELLAFNTNSIDLFKDENNYIININPIS